MPNETPARGPLGARTGFSAQSPTFFEELKSFAGFSSADAAVLKEIHPLLRPGFPATVEDFYRRLADHEATRRVLSSVEQTQRLKGTLLSWLDEVFLGPHDASYCEKRSRIGAMHVRVGLRQTYVFGAMSHIRAQLVRAIEAATPRRPDLRRAAGEALSKVLDIDLALIAGSYHEEEKYHDVVEYAPDMIHQVDSSGRFVNVNQTEVDRLGYTREKLLTMRLEEIVHPEDRETLRQHLKRVFDQGQSRCELRLLTSSGQPVDVEIQATGKRDEVSGEFVWSRAYLRDVTERRAIESALIESQERFKAFMDNSPAVAFMKDEEGRFVYVNRQFERFFRLDRAQWLLKTDFDLWPEEVARSLRENDAVVLCSGKVLETTERVPAPDGRACDWLVFKFPWKDAAGRQFLGGMAVDVTDRNRMQKALAEQASLTRLGEMAAVVAHEVKNPLAGIRGAIQIIGERLAAGREEESVIREIIERIDTLNETVNDLLLYARPRLPSIRPVPLQALLQDTAGFLLNDPQLGRVDVHIEGPELTVPADADLLKPVFLNLFLNAAQALEGTGQIRVTTSVEGGRCRIEIADKGPGIPPEVRERIFEPFFSTKRRGTGLGLPISKRLIEAHAGDISIACPPGGGTTVVIHLPLGD